MDKLPASLERIVASTAGEPVGPEILAMAEAVRARHEPGVAAVIAYGSSLRGVAPGETLIDLYVLTDSLAAVSRSILARLACRLVPPNVYYAECDCGGLAMRAKYAVMPLKLLVAKTGPATNNPYFWARFAQPCRIVYARDESVRVEVAAMLAEAVRSMIAASLPLARPGDGPLELWERGLDETYRTELRSEAMSRAREIVAANPGYYHSVTNAVLGPGWTALQSEGANAGPLLPRRLAGKILSVLRLSKAAFTFQGGADYLAWKIARHSGVEVKLKAWQRRHPIIAALWLLPGLIRRGAVR